MLTLLIIIGIFAAGGYVAGRKLSTAHETGSWWTKWGDELLCGVGGLIASTAVAWPLASRSATAIADTLVPITARSARLIARQEEAWDDAFDSAWWGEFWWVLIPAVLAFVAGFALGYYAQVQALAAEHAAKAWGHAKPRAKKSGLAIAKGVVGVVVLGLLAWKFFMIMAPIGAALFLLSFVPGVGFIAGWLLGMIFIAPFKLIAKGFGWLGGQVLEEGWIKPWVKGVKSKADELENAAAELELAAQNPNLTEAQAERIMNQALNLRTTAIIQRAQEH